MSATSSNAARLNVIIVGAGLCGLSAAISIALAGHQVSIFEAHPGAHEFGAGLQTSPNGTRIYTEWGLSDSIRSIATMPEIYQIRRFDGAILAQRQDYDAEVPRRYGYPLWLMHRVDLQAVLLRRATELGVEIFYSSNVVDVNCGEPYIQLEDGSRRRGDFVVVADGVWSKLRSVVLGQQIDAEPTGDIAYRITIDRPQVEDEEVLAWMKQSRVQIWVGREAHAVAYSVRGSTQMNLVLLATQDLPGDGGRVRGNVEEPRQRFEGWDPLLTKLLSYVEKVDKWRLMSVPALPTWRSKNGTVVLSGDCCHAILPYMAQGLNMALEDAATLGTLMRYVKTRNQLSKATSLYEKIRIARTSQLLAETRAIRNEFHLQPGVAREKRDAHLMESFEESDWAYPKSQSWVWPYDAFDEAEKAYRCDPY
ncbi:putative monooxygenase [Daldinia sp. FL1419]|nr:putative monooxygenase [Daldinia sp. FL1419]